MREPLLISTSGVAAFPQEIPHCSPDDLISYELSKVSFLIVPISEPYQDGYALLQRIRQHLDPTIYLKPTVFYQLTDNLPREIMQAGDGLIPATGNIIKEDLDGWSAKFEPVNERIEGLKLLSDSGDSDLAFRVLRFIETRNSEIKPIPSANRKSGYVYPTLAPLFPREDLSSFEILDFLESQRLVASSFLGRSHSCTHCDCAFLNFFETCPDCGSNDLRSDELIHHFKCAYVGEQSDFDHGDGKLVCPKCDANLKQLGVDHDKASVVFHCNSCSHVFQDPKVMTACYNCCRETEPENQAVRDIRTYTITAIGQNGARYGMDSLLQSILESNLDTIAHDVFQKYLNLEAERITRYKISESSLVIMQLDGIEKIYEKLGRRSTEVFNEIGVALRDQLRSSDVFSVRDENIFLVLMTETATENADVAISRLDERIIELLNTNLNMKCTINKTIQPVTKEVNLDQSIENLLQDHVS